MLPRVLNCVAVSWSVIEERQCGFGHVAFRLQTQKLQLVQVVVDDVLHRPHGHLENSELLGHELHLVRPLPGDGAIHKEGRNYQQDRNGDLVGLTLVDPSRGDLYHLRKSGLVQTIPAVGRDRALVVLTKRGEQVRRARRCRL
jgi:hypothetical protein